MWRYRTWKQNQNSFTSNVFPILLFIILYKHELLLYIIFDLEIEGRKNVFTSFMGHKFYRQTRSGLIKLLLYSMLVWSILALRV